MDESNSIVLLVRILRPPVRGSFFVSIKCRMGRAGHIVEDRVKIKGGNPFI